MAKILVQRAAHEVSDERELYLRMAAEIGDESERAAFVAEADPDDSLVQPRPSLAVVEASGGGLPEELLRVAAYDLAQSLGPIASVLVKRAAKQARDERHLYRLLALEISDPAERRRFLLMC
jgi:eukaryotic-like serine/threonine-protein kinase